MGRRSLPVWYRLLVYPSTKKGGAAVVLQQVQGHQWRCDKHEKIKCKGCASFEKSKILHTWRDRPYDADMSVDMLLGQILASVLASNVEVLEDGRTVVVINVP